MPSDVLGPAVDIGVAVYTVASAPSVDRPHVMAREAGRLGGALAGGWAGGEAAEWAIDQLYPPAETHFEEGS